jgi:hypothetical protein
MRLLDTLEELPIAFDEERHEYRWVPTGEIMSTSVTRVCSASKDARALANIERTRSVWEPRGKHVHAVLESHLNGEHGPYEDWADDYDGPYPEYCKPMLAHPLWEYFQPIAIEYRVCDLKRNIGGSLDALGWDHLTDRMVLLDLKSQRTKNEYDTSSQLGAYLSMLIDHKRVLVDECITFWARPGQAQLGGNQPPDACLQSWETSYDLWAMLQEEL